MSTDRGDPADYASAFSAHPDPAVAVGELVGGVLERLGPHPALAVLLAAEAIDGLEEIVATVNRLLAPANLIGSTTGDPFAGPQGPSRGCGLVLWATTESAIEPLRLTVGQTGPPVWPTTPEDPGSVAVLLGGSGFTVDGLDVGRQPQRGRPMVVAGLASGPRGRPPVRLIDGSGVHAAGAVGMVVPGRLAQVFRFEVGIWEEDDPLPEPPINPVTGRSLFLFAGRHVDVSGGHSLDLEVLFERFAGATAGLVADPRLVGPADDPVRPERSLSGPTDHLSRPERSLSGAGHRRQVAAVVIG